MPTHRRGPGRPRGRVPHSRRLVTQRIRSLVEEVHRGNLSEAARHTRLPYGTLRDLFLDRTANPSLKTLKTIVEAYGLTPTWFTNPESGERPAFTLETVLPPDPDYRRGNEGRRFSLPLSAWPFARLVLRLESYLTSLPPSPERPIVGALTDPVRIRQHLVVFLLTPLLEGQRRGLVTILGAEPPFKGAERADERARGLWVETLRALGAFWEGVLDELLVSADSAG